VLAQCAAQALGARYAFAAETLNELESRSLAYWEGAGFGEGFSYRFPGTPCRRVEHKRRESSHTTPPHRRFRFCVSLVQLERLKRRVDSLAASDVTPSAAVPERVTFSAEGRARPKPGRSLEGMRRQNHSARQALAVDPGPMRQFAFGLSSTSVETRRGLRVSPTRALPPA
jgi:hypothetical protein